MERKPFIDAEKIPNLQRRRLALPLLRIVKAAFKSPEVQRDFEEWKRKKEAANAEVHSTEVPQGEAV